MKQKNKTESKKMKQKIKNEMSPSKRKTWRTGGFQPHWRLFKLLVYQIYQIRHSWGTERTSAGSASSAIVLLLLLSSSAGGSTRVLTRESSGFCHWVINLPFSGFHDKPCAVSEEVVGGRGDDGGNRWEEIFLHSL